MIELDKERQRRFTPTVGKTVRTLGEFLSKPPAKLTERGMTPPAQAMPEEYRVQYDPVKAYRQYYIGRKQHIATWTNRVEPYWFQRRTS